MHVLFVHQNFPAQFRHIAPRLASDYGWRCSFVTTNTQAPAVRGVERIGYRPRGGATPANAPFTRDFENAVAHAQGVYAAMKRLPDVRPDLVVAHSGFGSSLFLPHLYGAPVVNFMEYFYRPSGRNFGYRPDVPVTETQVLRCGAGNPMILLDLDNCDRGWSPSEYQRDLFPPEYRNKIEVCPEGIDTALWHAPTSRTRRNYGITRQITILPNGTPVSPSTRIVTYISRGFERMRGFDIFMRAAKLIYQRYPDVLFVVVGSDRICYGSRAERGPFASFRERVLAEGEYDLSKFRFTGRLPERDLARLLSISDLHVYLTHPFVTSWSMLDAMSCGCVVLASDQTCTREYITHNRNGLLCDFFDVEGIADQAVKVLRDPAQYKVLGTAARYTIEEEYSLDVCLPRLKKFFEEVASKKREPSFVSCSEGFRPAVHEEQAGCPHYKGRLKEWPAFDGTIPFCSVARAPRPCVEDEAHGRGARATGEGEAGSNTVLFCWELGGGLGHLMQMLPLARGLAGRGHRVFVALRDLHRATSVFGGAGVSFLSAPHSDDLAPRYRRPASFAQMLANLGFGDGFELFGVACAWRNLFRMVGPDLVVFDHSPTALLASRGIECRRAVIGSGFCCPPDVSPMPVFRPECAEKIDPQKLAAFERGILDSVNRLLEGWGEEPLERLSQLYADADENFLTTFPELDHYPQRAEAAMYWGPVIPGPDGGGEAPRWPEVEGRHVFAYLKKFANLPDVLDALADAGHPTIAYVEGATAALRRRHGTDTLHFADGPLDLATVGEECDAAVLNGGHGVTAEMLLAGKPILQIPLALEQRLTADAVRRMGVGLKVAAGQSDAVRPALAAVLNDPGYTDAARGFADRYAAFDPERQCEAMLARAEELLCESPALV